MSTSPCLDFRELFELSDPLASRPLRLTAEGHSDWLTREQASALFTGQLLQPDHTLRLGAYKGGKATDFLWCALTPVVCISGSVVELLEEHGFTGWSTYPVEVYGRRGERLAGYSGLAVTGRGGKRKRSRSRVITKPPPAAGGKSYQIYKGLYFDESRWDGSSIFLVEGIIIITQPVKDALKRAKVTNVRFTPLVDVEIDVYLDRFP